MNLKELFDTQAELDKAILAKHPVQDGEDRLSKKILALLVELGELANEHRGFKFWSENQKPVTKSISPIFGTNSDGSDYQSFRESNPLLEEYVDCLHFILSIGLEFDFQHMNLNEVATEGMKQGSVTRQFNFLFTKIGDFNIIKNHNNFMYIIPLFIGLGEMLGFTESEIKNAYLAKNKINHERQANGY